MSDATHEYDPGRDLRVTHTFGDYAYDAIYVAGIGGGAIALFFLVWDVVTRGQMLFTPSLLGSVVFDHADPRSVETVNMLAVAKFTLLHFFAFGVLGLLVSLLTHQAEMRSRHPLIVIAMVFAMLEVGFWVAASLAFPGVIDRIGHGPVAAANLIAAVGVAAFLVFTHKPGLWRRTKQAAHIQ